MNRAYEKLVDGAIDEIDAAIFSGDTFMDVEVVADFRAMMVRWEKQIASYEELMTTLPKPDPFLMGDKK